VEFEVTFIQFEGFASWGEEFGGDPPPAEYHGGKYLGSFPMSFHFNPWCLMLIVACVKHPWIQN
jgi:hypothetical protein